MERKQYVDNLYKKLGEITEQNLSDIILIHPKSPNLMDIESLNPDERKKMLDDTKLRNIFEKTLRKDGFKVTQTVLSDEIYTKLRCSFQRLCVEAEKTNLQMPLLDKTYPKNDQTNICSQFIYNNFETDTTVYPKSARFTVESIRLFENHKHPNRFFRPAVRTLLVNNILINMNIKKNAMKAGIRLLEDDDNMNSTGENSKNILNFPYMIKLGLYTDHLILHEPSDASKLNEERPDRTINDEIRGIQDVKDEDQRKILNDKWTAFFKFQPLTKIRNYFGEKIAFYFTWSGLLMTSLWVPMILGLIIFIYGIVRSSTNSTASKITKTLAIFNGACDNDVTPFYALIICVWGTLFLKLWRRKTATLAYKWAVDEFAFTEPDRPQFYGTQKRKHPVTGDNDWYYPTREQLKKFLLSGLTSIFMLCVVLASVIGVIVYRVFASVDYCPNMSAQACVMVTTVVSSLLNTISILILSKIYYWIARRLTDWENHRTQTSFDDALTVKLFAFEFANNYSSCFYIAYVRGRLGKTGIFGLGETYTDNCEPDGNCMSELSIQILILISCKPLPRFFNDIVLLWLKRLLKKLHQYCCKSKVYVHDDKPEELTFEQIEALKPSLGDFTMEEHTEKIIQYGFLMLFAASFPLAPLIVLITNLIDIRLDAWRMLWWYRRPLATTAQGIGIWYIILQFVNICGVISNGFLIGFTSSWGRKYDVYTRLWIVVGFEHLVFALKLILDYLVPDVPSVVRLMAGKTMHDMSTKIKDDRKQFEENYLKFVKVTILNQVDEDGTTKKLRLGNKKEALKRSCRSNSKYLNVKHGDRTLCVKVTFPRNYSNVNRPICDTHISSDSRDGSKQSDDSMA